MAERAPADGFDFSVATAPSRSCHRLAAAGVIVAMLAAYLGVILFAPTGRMHADGLIPIMFAIIFIADLVCAVLLFAQFSATGSRPLLFLAGGYLFSSLMVAAHVLTSPGVFSPTGLAGAGPQSAMWLYILWRLGFSGSIIAYAAMKLGTQEQENFRRAPRSATTWSVAIVIAIVAALLFVTISAHDLFPALVSDGQSLPLVRNLNTAMIITDVVAILLLARTGVRSVLDVWLVVVAFALMAECMMMAFFVEGRSTAGFYAVRLIGMTVSKVVLVVLLWESMRLYANLAISHRELQRERASRLTNAATLMAAIAHEVRQPLAGINLLAYAGQQSLGRPTPDVRSGKNLFGEIKQAAGRANEVFDNFLRLTRGARRELQPIDVNALTTEATSLLKANLDSHNVTTVTKLTPDLPVIMGHPGQMREVLLNLIQNAIDAMSSSSQPRVVTIVTRRGPGAVSISLQDTGPGIEPEYLTAIFDPFVSTKAKGNGLGLAICKMIVDQHGGKLTAMSGRDGGARFEIMLPVRVAAAATPEMPDERQAPLQAVR